MQTVLLLSLLKMLINVVNIIKPETIKLFENSVLEDRGYI